MLIIFYYSLVFQHRRRGIGGEPAQDENTNPEKLQQNTTTIRQDNTTDYAALPKAQERGKSHDALPNENIFENDNKIQQTEGNTLDNQPLTEVLETPDTITVISQEQLRELLYPISAAEATAKEANCPKRSHLENQQHE